MLTTQQVRDFFSVGFVVERDVFSPGEVRTMRRAFERLEQTAYRLGTSQIYRGAQFVLGPGHSGEPTQVSIQRIVWCGAAERVLARLGEDPRLVAIASQLLGSATMNHLINQAHFKLPGDGVEFPWHQDSVHRRYGGGEWRDVNGRGSYVQMITAVDDITEENGPMQFIPGSCRRGHVAASTHEQLVEPEDARGAVTLTMPAGSVLIFGPYTFHRSQANCSAVPRRVFINGFAYPGANSRVYPGEGAGRLVSYRS
jgi:ectoine hydroxylase-related dioxygenase (phytanoyl-CoA dioxygenase family)